LSRYGATSVRHGCRAFIQDGERDSSQQEFVREVEHWQTGLFRQSFRTPEELRTKIVRALHKWSVASTTAPLDPKELLQRALNILPKDKHGRQSGGPFLALSIAAGPAQPVLRPSELEAPKLAKDLQKEALLGDLPIFNPKAGSQAEMEEDFLVISQERGTIVRLDTQGSIVLQLAVAQNDHGMSLH
jgi:hypothetical protein